MRHVASSVGVVTSSAKAGRYGATLSAFSSASAEPPQLLVCLRSASRLAAAVSANGNFCLNILLHRHPHVAERFSGRHDDALDDRFTGKELSHDEEDWIVLKDTNTFACAIVRQFASSTHTIFVGGYCEFKLPRKTRRHISMAAAERSDSDNETCPAERRRGEFDWSAGHEDRLPVLHCRNRQGRHRLRHRH